MFIMFNEIKDKLKDTSIVKEPKRISRNKNTITKIENLFPAMKE